MSIADSEIIKRAFDHTWEAWPEHAAKILNGATAPGTQLKNVYFYDFSREDLRTLICQNEAVEVQLPVHDKTLRFFEVKIFDNEGEIEATSLREAIYKQYPLFADQIGGEWRVFTDAQIPAVDATQIRIVLQPFPGSGSVIPYKAKPLPGPLMIKEWYLHHPRFETPLMTGLLRARTCDALIKMALSHPDWIVVRRWTRTKDAISLARFFGLVARYDGFAAH